MTADRDVDDISTAPGGKSGSVWTAGVRESVLALWALNGGVLLNVAGTNALTGDIAISDGFTAYSDGLRVGFVPANTNTGAMTLNAGGVGVKALRDPDGDATVAGAVDDRYGPGVFEGIYWAVVTASTVGYGDKAPVRPLGRVLAMLVIIISLPMSYRAE